MSNTIAYDKWLEHRAEQLILLDQLKLAEIFNGLGALVDGYAACRTQFLPFCLLPPHRLSAHLDKTVS